MSQVQPASARTIPLPDARIATRAGAIAVLLLPAAALLAVAAAGTGLRIWELDTLGFNSDEAVYAGQAAAIAADPALRDIFPIFRAHPLLFQYVLAIGTIFGTDDIGARVISAAVGMLTVGLGFLLGRTLYGTRVGVFTALFMALMPYHVIVTRQVLLDGPMTLFATLALYLVAKFADSGKPAFLYAAGAAMGLTFLAKETGIILLGGIYAFLALSPEVRVRIRDLFLSIVALALVIAPFPLSLSFAGGEGASKAGSYLVWQLFRRANHDWIFYPETVPAAIGFGVVAVAVLGLVLARRWIAWQEKLLLAWIVVPVIFFQLWPVKGFQYLLPLCAPFAVLAAFAVCDVFPATIWRRIPRPWIRDHALPLLLGGILGVALALTSWFRVQVAVSGEFLAGSGGVPGGREAGIWISENVPEGATLMTIGPSMANIVQYYGHRPAFGLSVSPNPLHRNPSYEPILNPDLEIRSGEMQYIVWDSFSAARSTFFGDRVREYAERYHGRVVHTESITVRTAAGEDASVPVIVIYEVRP
jgi:Dolichyl-phosphate-mannose-protein mannosyltransferase